MYRFLKTHEAYIKQAAASAPPEQLLRLKAYHMTQIRFLQHERLMHLLVTLFFGMLLFASYVLTCFCPVPFLFALDVIVTVLELFYIVHYYRLENGVQRWYTIYNDMK